MNQTAFILTLLFPILLTAEDWPTHAHDNRRILFSPANGWPRNDVDVDAHKNFSNINYDIAYRVVASGKVAWFSA